MHRVHRVKSCLGVALLIGAGGISPMAMAQPINEDHKLVADDGATFDYFGRSIAVGSGFVVVGADLDDDNGSLSGAAYIYNSSTGAQVAKLLPSDGASNDWFGHSVSLQNNTLVIGAYGDDDNGAGSGSAYVFDTHCPADLNGDGVLNFFDISQFLAAFNTGHTEADFNGDGLFNFFDISAFLAAFSAGCP